MSARYWVGGNANWDATAGTKWATTSGGAGGQTVPTSSDDVYFDANSGNVTVTFTSTTVRCLNFTSTNFTGTFAGYGDLRIYGNYILGASVITTQTGSQYFYGGNITTNGKILLTTIWFSGNNTLQDDFTCQNNGVNYIENGTFNANNKNINILNGSLYGDSLYPATINMGSGTWTLSGSTFRFYSGDTFNGDTSTIKLITPTVNASINKTFDGGSNTFNNLWFATTTAKELTIQGSNTFNNLKVDAGLTVKFTDTTTQTVTSTTIIGTAASVIILQGTSTGGWNISDSTGTNTVEYCTISRSAAAGGATFNATNSTDGGNNSGWTITAPVLATVTTEAVSSIASVTAVGNGNITDIGSSAPTKRGFVYSTSTHGAPGNVAPASSGYGSSVTDTGTYSTGAYTKTLTSLVSSTTYYVRAYVQNYAGYSYGDEVSFLTLGFINPGNIYADDGSYTTFPATSGVLTVELSKDAGVNWTTPLEITFTGSDTLQTCGNGSTELWGNSWTRADMVNANFRVRLSQGSERQTYKTFGFSTGSEILTGLKVAIEGNYASSTISLDLLEVKIHYGTSVLPVKAGSQAFASNGRKAGEGAGSGTGVLVYYDSANWIASDTGATVAA